MKRTRQVRGREIPAMFYGTAWKEERTKELTLRALRAGFRAIDTANQRKHYHEAGVGEAVAEFLAEGGATREELFLQTKFTYASGQDERLPYDPKAPIEDQVRQSFASSLEHLGTDYVDSLVLHGPARREQLMQLDLRVWKAMEELLDAGKVRALGVSNVTLRQLTALSRDARIKPTFVQNRTFAREGWARPIRVFCRDYGLVYQGFSWLTANKRELEKPEVAEIAKRLGATVPQVVFRFALEGDAIPITGTTSDEHMKEDLAAFDLELTAGDMRVVSTLGGPPPPTPPRPAE
ncbi:MAG TPA: aldo/keto reductase [Byssovorax sp.]|jgi:diketogulonate reductase-like aldo/keto reductase